MLSTKMLRAVLVLSTTLGLISCSSSTRLDERWHDESYEKGSPLKNILVLGIFKEDIQRRAIETAFVKLIEARGTQAIAGYTLMPEAKDYDDKEDIIAAVKKVGADSVLITSFKGISEKERNIPATVEYLPTMGRGYGYGFYDPYYPSYYGRTYDAVYQPGYTVTDTIVQLETLVYSAQPEKLVWAGKTKSINASSGQKLTEDLTRIVTDDMRENGLID